MPLLPGTRLGTYEIQGPLGAGGMGEVHRARDLRLGRDVAIKVLPSNVAASPERLARFEREARIVAGLNHPNIVTLYSVEDEEGVRFLTMELVEGQSLANLVSPGGLPLARLLELGAPLADALAAAHERGIVHRDLKPGNVMVTREHRVKVLDFGLARIMNEPAPVPGAPFATTAGLSLSDPGQVLGTIPYMAPEQIRGEAVDARCDLFALGIILYELATGRRPFGGRTPPEVSASILRDAPEPLLDARPDLPAGFGRIVALCLEKSPRERIQTALGVSTELRALLRDVEHGVVERPAPSRPSAAGIPSIAVLPFVNRSASADDEYFSDGLADELLNVLAKIKGLRVSARSSSFYFKGKDVPLGEIGTALKVATVLEGSVRKAGNRVRISVQLVKVPDGYHLWSETYDRMLEDIFAVQDDIAQSVVRELRTTLLGEQEASDVTREVRAEVTKAARGRGTDPEAHRLFLLARHLTNRWTREDMAKGIEHLREALELEPTFALAWAALGGTYAREAGRGWTPVSEGYGRARAAVERAIALEPDLAEAHLAMGWIRMTFDWDWKGADASYQRALESAPGHATVLALAGVLAGTLGRHEEAVALYRRVQERDPLNVALYNNLGLELYTGGQFAEAEAAYREALELAPQAAGARAGLALTLLSQGRNEEALAEAAREPEKAYQLWALAIAYHTMGHGPESDAALRELTETGALDHAYQIAEVHAARGEADATFEWLDRAYAQRDSGLAEAKANPCFRSLHEDPRWGAFLKRMGVEG